MNAAFGARRLRRFTVRTSQSVGIIRARPAWRALKRAEARAPFIQNIFSEDGFSVDSVVKDFFTTAAAVKTYETVRKTRNRIR